MKHKPILRKCWNLLVSFVLLLPLSGCLFQSMENLYHLPQQSAEHQQLTTEISNVWAALALEHSGIEYANIVSGDNTSTVQLHDLGNTQETDTAIAYLRVPSAETPLKIFLFTLNEEGNYVPNSVIEGQGTSIQSVDFADLNGFGKKEIIINWQTNQMSVYSLDFTQTMELDTTQPLMAQIPAAMELLSTNQNAYALMDLTGNGITDLSAIRLDAAGLSSFVELFHWSDGALASHSIAPLSASITSLSRVRTDHVTGYIPALYVSANLVDNARTTDIFVVKGDRLTNLTMDADLGISTLTLREYRDITPTDINGDGILEVPDPVELPTYLSEEALANPNFVPPAAFWLIDWNQYDSKGNANYIYTTYHNISDGWYLTIPDHWRGQITVSRDDTIIGQRAVIFSKWNGAGSEPTPFLAIYKLTGANRDSRAKLGGRFELGGDTTTLYAADFYEDSWDCGMDQGDLIQRFGQIISSWS